MRGWMGTWTILKLVAGIGLEMGIRVLGMVGMGINICPCAALYCNYVDDDGDNLCDLRLNMTI